MTIILTPSIKLKSIEDMLRLHRSLGEKLEILQEREEYLNNYTGVNSPSFELKVKGNSGNSKLINVISSKGDTEYKSKQLSIVVNLLKTGLNSLTKEEYEIIDYTYFQNNSWKTVCNYLNIEKSTYYRRRETALNKIATIMYQ